MKKRKALKISLLALAAVIVAALALWRLLPRSLADVLNADPGTVAGMAAQVTVTGVADGKSVSEAFTLDALPPESEHFRAILELLDSTGYRPDFRNLLPWRSSTGGMIDDRTVRVVFAWGTDPARTCEMSLNRGDKVVVQWWSGDGTDRVGRPQFYHPTDRSVKDALADYLIAHGEAAE